MDSVIRDRLHDMVLDARKLLMDETVELLEGIYGVSRVGKLEDESRLPAIQRNAEVRETRRQLVQYLRNERASNTSHSEAIAKLIKEVAFTWLNRFAAFKLLEARKLIRTSLGKGMQSDGFVRWIVEPENTAEYVRYEAGLLPQDDLGEGPRDTAYRHYLLHLCAEQAKDIQVLFDPDVLSSHLFPRPRTLQSILELINDEKLKDAWMDFESVGWIYQYFNEEEKKEVFASFSEGEKVKTSEVPAATQLFTPQWIVEALVWNSLGRLWLQMHPDSTLRERTANPAHPDYLLPDIEAPTVSMRPVREITLLDPACGTMHFGLVAFDLFVAMYQEEIERAGEPGWPESPSVQDAQDIPSAIIEHNLYGIDIDLRAVQLSALTLLLKARSLNPQAKISDHNLACASVTPLKDEYLRQFLAETHFSRPIYTRLVSSIWTKLKFANQMGSLVQLEADLNNMIDGRPKQQGAEAVSYLPGLSPEQLRNEDAQLSFWNNITEEIIETFDAFSARNTNDLEVERYFTNEVIKGFRILRLMLRRYDIVVTNPPYMSSRNMSSEMNNFLKRSYPDAKGDLYAAFIDRCTELATPRGRVAMITQQSFMTLGSYEKLRRKLRDLIVIESLIHAGPHAFAEIAGEKVNTTLFVLRREADACNRDNAYGTYIRLVSEPNAAAKQRRFERALRSMRGGENDPIIFHYRQGDFDAIPGAPWVYWITPDLRRLFQTLPKLGEVAQPVNGSQTADNIRFLRYWWEVGTARIGFSCADAQAAQATGKRWFPYMKGGSFQRWWGNQEYTVNWAKNGAEIRLMGIESGRLASRTRNTEIYFRRGVTWTDLTSGRFSARLSPGGFIFDVAGSSVFPPDVSLVLAVMNSTLAQYILKFINPTLHVQVGDLGRLPISTTASETIHELVEEAIALQRAESSENETTYEFIAPPPWKDGIERLITRARELASLEHEIDEEVYRLYGIGPDDRKAIEMELAGPAIGNDVSEATPLNGDNVTEGDETETKVTTKAELAVRWISYAVGIVLGRFSPGKVGELGCGHISSKIAEQLRDLALPNGVAVVEPGHPSDLTGRVEAALELLVGDDEVALVAAATGGKALADWLVKDYFSLHLKLYRKRPVYWLLQSPKRRYNLYVFHERLTRDTLHLIQGNQYLGGRITQVRDQIKRLKERIASEDTPFVRRELERDHEAMHMLMNDLESFMKALQAVTNQTNSRGQIVGWIPEIDDGVLINIAPLRELIPSWAKEPRQCWNELEAGQLDWSRTAMRYWPDRVLQACLENRSYAIAHGM
jgi:hypothetical protein